MKAQILSLTILATLLSSCMNQPSAPIEYGSQTSSSAKSSSNADDIVEQPIIREKTNWGDTSITNDVQNVTPEEESNDTVASQAQVAPSIPRRTETITHEVIEGETVDSIAKQYDISKDALIAANKLKAPYHLEELQILKIPPQSSDNNNSEDSVSVGDVITPNSTNGASPQAIKKSSSILPVQGTVISKFGTDNAGVKNNGINIESALGESVHSLSSGDVVYAGNDPKFGNLIIIKSENEDIFMAYSHMSDLILKKGDPISNSQIIGHVGQTGNVTSPQLHFAVRRGKTPIDPQLYLTR